VYVLPLKYLMFLLEVMLDWKASFSVDEGVSCSNCCILHGYWET